MSFELVFIKDKTLILTKLDTKYTYVNHNQGRMVRTKLPILKLFPILLTILLVWSLCAILTATNAIGQLCNYAVRIRTD